METRLVSPRNADARILGEIEQAGTDRALVTVQLPQTIPQRFDHIPVSYRGVRSIMFTDNAHVHEVQHMLEGGEKEAIATPLYLRREDDYIAFSFRSSALFDFMRHEADQSEMMFAKVGKPLSNSKFGNGYMVITTRGIAGHLITDQELPNGLTVVAKTKDYAFGSRGLPYYVFDLEDSDYSWQEIAEANDSGDVVSGTAIGFDNPTRPNVLQLSYSTGFPSMYLPLSETSHYIATDIKSRVSYFLSLIHREIFGKVIAFEERRKLGTFSMAQAQDDLLAQLRVKQGQEDPFTVEITEPMYVDRAFKGWRVWADHLLKGYLPEALLDMPGDFDPLSVVGRSVTVNLREIKPYNRYFDLIVKPVTDFTLYPESLSKDWTPPQPEAPEPTSMAQAFGDMHKD